MASFITCHVKELHRVNGEILFDRPEIPLHWKPKIDDTIPVGAEWVHATIIAIPTERSPVEFVVVAKEIN
jgi:hypothetical protein